MRKKTVMIKIIANCPICNAAVAVDVPDASREDRPDWDKWDKEFVFAPDGGNNVPCEHFVCGDVYWELIEEVSGWDLQATDSERFLGLAPAVEEFQDGLESGDSPGPDESSTFREHLDLIAYSPDILAYDGEDKELTAQVIHVTINSGRNTVGGHFTGDLLFANSVAETLPLILEDAKRLAAKRQSAAGDRRGEGGRRRNGWR
jgi:hypothetical protein